MLCISAFIPSDAGNCYGDVNSDLLTYSSHSEANDSELLEIIEDIYRMNRDVVSSKILNHALICYQSRKG